jgi:glycosyltransferase involved in cell wall biosynthesis
MTLYPSVSIGLAVRNGEKYLCQALDTLIAQNYIDFELLVSDNASTDRTQEICQQYSAKDHRIRYLRNKDDIGAIENFNLVFNRSRGRYFMWAGHDDYRSPEYIRTCVEALTASDKIVLAGTYCDCIDDQGNLVLLDKSMSTVGMDAPHRFMRYKQSLHDYNKHRGGIFYGLYRTDTLHYAMPLQKVITTDQDMMLRLCFLGEFVTVPERLLTRRMRGPSNSSGSLKGLADNYKISNPLLIYGAYISREYNIDRTIVNAGLKLPEKARLMLWSLLHTITSVSTRVLSLLVRGLGKKW